MKDALHFVLPGGTGNLGRDLRSALLARGHRVTTLTRGAEDQARGTVHWDACTDGPWQRVIDGADVVVNLAGRSVDCRYNKHNLTDMLVSRTDSTRAVGRAIAAATRKPKVWLQMSTATVYAHSLGSAWGEDGELGGHEPGVPGYWRYSVEIAKAWERALWDAETPGTRKVALRTAMVMSRTPGGPFPVLRRLATLGVGGPVAGGAQYVSWIHAEDFVNALLHIVAHDDLEGVINIASPDPIPHRDFMTALRRAVGVPIGMGATRWMVEMAAIVLGTDAELILKSRRVVPARLLAHGFQFRFPDWPAAAQHLVRHIGEAS